MVTYDEVARARSERGEVVLRRRLDSDVPTPVLELRVNGVFVMDTREASSEVALARSALGGHPAPRRVLVGGLGLGYTAREVLADPRVERVVVAEIEEALLGWFDDGTVATEGLDLDDPRLTVRVGPVQQVVAEAGDASYDVVLLDVDNGPDFLVLDDNAAIYEADFLARVARVLAPGGQVVIWSSTRSTALETALGATFGGSEVRPMPVTLQGRDETYWLHLAARTAD